MKKAEQIKEEAHRLGFELVGIAPAFPISDYDFFRWWLDQGYAASMEYLRRGAEKRGDPGKILPGAKSIICCGLNYHIGESAGSISSYAWGDDYHEVVGSRLKKLEEFLRVKIDGSVQMKSYVDTGAILERSYAAKAGLGWIGKNTCVINNGLGSFFFIGEILTTLEFEASDYDRPVLDQCGTCTKCLDACPTGALPEPYLLDSNKCISYLTIEYRGDFSPDQSKIVGEHLYGCDICQQVCPYNERIPISPLKEFRPRTPLFEKEGPGEISPQQFSQLTRGSAMNRIKYSQWQRNLQAVKRNKG